MSRSAAFLLSVLSTAPVLAQSYSGVAYSSASGRLLYTESHWIYKDDHGPRRLVLYRCPDGKPFARKRIDMGPGPTAPDFNFEDARSGYSEGVRTRANGREVFYRMNASSREQAAPLAPHKDVVIDAGFDAFVVENWAELNTLAAKPISFVVPSRLGYVDFIAQATMKKDPIRRFRLGVASWYSFALPHIDVGYDAASHRLRDYRGLSNVRNERQHNIDVHIEFPAVQWRHDVSIEEIRADDRAVLDGRCETD